MSDFLWPHGPRQAPLSMGILHARILEWVGGAKMVQELDGETTFFPTNSSKEHLNAEQASQNNFWSPAEDIRCPEKQPIVFERW